MWWCLPVIPAFGRMRRKESSGLIWVPTESPSQKHPKEEQEKNQNAAEGTHTASRVLLEGILVGIFFQCITVSVKRSKKRKGLGLVRGESRTLFSSGALTTTLSPQPVWTVVPAAPAPTTSRMQHSPGAAPDCICTAEALKPRCGAQHQPKLPCSPSTLDFPENTAHRKGTPLWTFAGQECVFCPGAAKPSSVQRLCSGRPQR